MPTKDQLQTLYYETSNSLTSTLETWTDYLTVVGNLYKYPAHEQVLIYAQKPTATACAGYQIWNNKMNRYVIKDTKGIALIDPLDDSLPIKYVFDISNTGGRANMKTPFIWQMKDEYEPAVLKMFADNFDVNSENIFEAIDTVAKNLSMMYYDNNKKDFAYLVEDSLLEQLDEDSLETFCQDALSVSIAYTLTKRCGFDTEESFTHEDFLPIFNFNTAPTITFLGAAVSESTEQVCREIATTIAKFERSKEHERINLQTRGRLPDSEHRSEEEHNTTGQMGQDEEKPLDEQSKSTLHTSTIERTTSRTLSGNRQNSEREIGTSDDPTPQNPTSTRQDETTNAMGSTYEQPQSTSRGNHNDGANLQLNFDNQEIITGEQVSLFPTEETQIKSITDRQNAKAQSQSVISLSTRIKADKLTHYVEDFFNGLDTKYAGTIIADMPEIKVWDHLGKSKNKKKHLTITLHSPVTDFRDNAFTYFNKNDTSDEVTMNDAIFYDPFLSLLRQDKDFSINFSPDTIFVFYQNIEQKEIDFSLAPNAEKYKIDIEPRSKTPYFDGYLSIKNDYPNAVVLYPLGDFYEVFNEDAMMMAKKFNLRDMHRVLDDSGARTPMVGVPAHSLESYVESLRTDGHDVVICGKDDGVMKPYFMKAIRQTETDRFGTVVDTEQMINDIIAINKTYSFNALQVEFEARDTKADLPINENFRAYTSEQLKMAIDAQEKEVSIEAEEPQETLDPIQELIAQAQEHTDELAPNQHIETIDGTEFIFTKPMTNEMREEMAKATEVEVEDAELEDVELEIETDEELIEIEEIQSIFEVVAEQKRTAPEIIFFENFKDVEPTLNYDDYEDRDVIGYNIEGVQYTMGKVGDLTYTSTLTSLGPRGEVLGTSMTPEIYEKFNAWKESLHATIELSEPSENFQITDSELGIGTKTEKINNNIEAIRTLKTIEQEQRFANQGEQEILSKYVGFGGLAEVFEPDNRNYTAFKTLLTDEEYTSARASTLNAHYTSPTIIGAMYEAIEQMGFTTGNVLEPSCGVGNFFGLLPESMQQSNLYGIELDSLTGRLAQQLYPNANIQINGFEKSDLPDSFFDVAIGNVPFGNYKLNEKKYNNQGFMIHEHFFAKSLDKVRAGGVVAFITSKGTLDKENPKVRRYLAQRAELIGAIRLPNTAFKANAGTEVTSDIIFLQKRDRPIDIECDWIHLGKDENDIAVNSYFVENPQMVLGKMEMVSGPFGMESTCVADETETLQVQLANAISHLKAEITTVELDENELQTSTSIPADPSVKNFSYTTVDGEVYFRENSIMSKPNMNATALLRIKGMIELRNCVHELMRYQLEDYSDEVIKNEQTRLNSLYDAYTDKYGLINSRANSMAFQNDSSYYLLCSMEEVNEDGTLKAKADIFTKRTIKQSKKITSVDTPSEALAVSIGEKAKVDMEFMSQLTGKSEEELFESLKGVIFLNPEFDNDSTQNHYVTADEYLSGNIRNKLFWATEANFAHSGKYEINVEALTLAMPKEIEASEIQVKLGATWIDKKYINEFMYELFDTPYRYQNEYGIKVNYSAFTADWNISNKTILSVNDVAAYTTYGTTRANAYRILEDSLNLRDVRVYDKITDSQGKEKRVLNKDETTLAQQKQQLIKDAFTDWIFRDPQRRQELVSVYNEKFNSTRPREFDGSHITFGGMNPEISLRTHQVNAIARILYGGNTLLAHEVGAGKSFEMVAGAMESKRLGICHKSLFVVPNHLTEQMASEFLRLYPSANLLVATKKDFTTKNRKKFCARIATGDYDAVIIGHSQFERIPVSFERQERLLQAQIDEIIDGIYEVKASQGERFTVKQLERTKRGLERRLEKLEARESKDDVVTFEQLGIDRLYVDEAHSYKNLFLFTKMRNVAGLSTTDAQKSSDMFMKCRYMDEITGGKGVIFATGTPISNSMTELYTMQRYLQYDALKSSEMIHFDSWAANFGETCTKFELAPEGSGYRARTRFSKFFNLPELMCMFKEVADIKTSEELNLPTPKMVYETVVMKPTEIQEEMVQNLAERAKAVHARDVDPSVDNMLSITNDGRKLGLDQRLINPMLPDDEGSKVNACVNNVYRIWQDGAADKLTQLIFCDISTPKGKNSISTQNPLNDSEKVFNVYDDIRGKLVALGVPKEQVAFIHEANSEVQKKELFSKVRSGDVRVLLGSTAKCGAGMNVQDRLVALHDLDAPWRPGEDGRTLW